MDFTKKIAGLLVPVFALREPGDLGIGDTHSVRRAIDFCAELGFSVLQVLPVNETGGDHSPYNAISSVALDPVLLHLSPEEVPGLSALDLVEFAPENLRIELSSGPVKYPQVKAVKLALLRRAFDRFRAHATPQLAAYNDFSREHETWLRGYTTFRALLDEHHGDARWPLWAEDWRTLAGAEAQLENGYDEIKTRRRFYAYVQWVAYTQWSRVKAYGTEKGVRLMGDIPFGVSRYGADVWAEQELFDLDWSGGAPPERFFQGDVFTARWGQNWGIPLYAWTEHEKQNYAWWRRRVARTCDVFHAFRIDHVLGFFRVYSFPWTPERNAEFAELTEEQAAALTGGRLPQFLPHPDEPENFAVSNGAAGEALLHMILDAAGDSIVVAEDLGTVPDYVRPLLLKLEIPGFSIPIFERVEADHSFKPSSTYPTLNLVTYATHDHAPLATIYREMVRTWTGPNGHEGWLEVCRLMDYLGMDHRTAEPPREFTPELQVRLVEKLMTSPCWLAVLMITDLLGTEQRFNEPGSIGATNWSQRLDRSLSAFPQDAAYNGVLQKIAASIRRNHRI